jgi:hypothetical protein
MANNYSRCTVDPYIPDDLFTEHEVAILEDNGFTIQNEQFPGEGCYVYREEGQGDEDQWISVFQTLLKRARGRYPELTEIWVEGDFTCSRMRPGEFGGFAYRITEEVVAASWCEVPDPREPTQH